MFLILFKKLRFKIEDFNLLIDFFGELWTKKNIAVGIFCVSWKNTTIRNIRFLLSKEKVMKITTQGIEQMIKIMNNLQTQKHCLCFSTWVIVRSRAAVYFHCIQLLTPNHALTCCWKYDLLACLSGGLRLFVTWRRHWVEPNWKMYLDLGGDDRIILV